MTAVARTPHRPRTRFDRPDGLAAAEPPEARGLARDGVRLLAATSATIEHARFTDLGRYLRPGDLLVVNTSATRAAAVDGEHRDLGPVVVHFSTALDDGTWVIELRRAPRADQPIWNASADDEIRLPDGVALTLTGGYLSGSGPSRLWRTEVGGPRTIEQVLARHGRPIRYGYLSAQWPLETYQTVFADPVDPADPQASAEMPSAGRPFSIELVARLKSQGVLFAPITLHAGVSSPEHREPPLTERYRVPARTARLVNWTHRTARTRARAGRVIAVGTTATRALESATDHNGRVQAARGWTELVLGPDHPVQVVDGLITGMHDPDASHLLLLEAVAGAELIQRAYDAALHQRYLWHEFGDSCLLLP